MTTKKPEMKNYSVSFGAFVRGYASANFEAANDEEAKQKAFEIFKTDNGEEGLDWGEFDYGNLALPSIVGLCCTDADDKNGDILEGHDFAATAEDARDLVSAQMFSTIADLLSIIDEEIDQRKHSGNDEEWGELEAKSAQAHALLKRAQHVDC